MPIMQLTQAMMYCLPPCPNGKKRMELCDSILKGLYVEVRATSNDVGTYYLRYKNQEKKTQHKKLGITTQMSLEDARQAAKQLKAELSQGKSLKKAAVPTFAEFFVDSYLPHIQTHNRSWKNDEQMFTKHLRKHFGETPLDEIKKVNAQRLHTELKQQGLSPATCDHHLKLLRRILNVAVEWEVIESNPLARVQLFNADNKLERYLDEAQLRRLLDILYHDENRMVLLTM